ncbi:MAG: peptidoglycan-binding domain-containing protein [Steroidobacteraceae bacterium]|jgi:peptidoglycan hydrolase-like protein with peptidoglycan-binding domain
MRRTLFSFAIPFVLIVLLSPLHIAYGDGAFTQELAQGSIGSEVTALQQILNQEGYLSVSPTGYFGPLTEAAVTAFQTANGLEAVGEVGPLTRALLNSLAQPGNVQTSVATTTPSAAENTSACSGTLVLTGELAKGWLNRLPLPRPLPKVLSRLAS